MCTKQYVEMAFAAADFVKEVSSLVGNTVIVELSNGDKYVGRLIAVDPSSLTVCLGDVELGGETYKRVVLSGSAISKILLKEVRFDLEELFRRLERVFPRNVELRKDLGAVIVMKRIVVRESGVEGPPGPLLERVQRIYNEFLEESKAAKS